MISFINTWPTIVNGKPENVLETIIRLGNKQQNLQMVLDDKEDTGKKDVNGLTIWKWGAVEFIVYTSPTGNHQVIDRPAV